MPLTHASRGLLVLRAVRSTTPTNTPRGFAPLTRRAPLDGLTARTKGEAPHPPSLRLGGLSPRCGARLEVGGEAGSGGGRGLEWGLLP